MVRKLYGNEFGFISSSDFNTQGAVKEPGPYPKVIARAKYSTWDSPQTTITATGLSHGTNMPTNGKFVGMILHVEVNNLPIDQQLRFYKHEYPWAPADKLVLGTLTIPALKTGCFYSDPDTSDGSRTYNGFASLGVEMVVLESGGSSSLGIKGNTLLVALDTDTGDMLCPTGTTLTSGKCVPD